MFTFNQKGTWAGFIAPSCYSLHVWTARNLLHRRCKLLICCNGQFIFYDTQIPLFWMCFQNKCVRPACDDHHWNSNRLASVKREGRMCAMAKIIDALLNYSQTGLPLRKQLHCLWIQADTFINFKRYPEYVEIWITAVAEVLIKLCSYEQISDKSCCCMHALKDNAGRGGGLE